MMNTLLMDAPAADRLVFVAIDFETASPRLHPCSLGMVRVETQGAGRPPKLTKFDSLICPPEPPDYHQTRVHGLTMEHLRGAPSFKVVWEKCQHLLDGASFLVAHNMGTDRASLTRGCETAQLPLPQLEWRCTVKMAMASWPNRQKDGYKLDALCRDLGIPLQHHNAASDALACARLFLHLHDGLPLTREHPGPHLWFDHPEPAPTELVSRGKNGGLDTFSAPAQKPVQAPPSPPPSALHLVPAPSKPAMPAKPSSEAPPAGPSKACEKPRAVAREEERILELEQRLASLEAENARLRARCGMATSEPPLLPKQRELAFKTGREFRLSHGADPTAAFAEARLQGSSEGTQSFWRGWFHANLVLSKSDQLAEVTHIF